MQPSLRNVLNEGQLKSLGWKPDASFGNYVRVFPEEQPLGEVSDAIIEVLVKGYGADPARIEMKTDWITTTICPQRNGPSQNLAGIVNDARSMKKTAITDCSYAEPQAPPIAASAEDLWALYGSGVAAELQRLRANRESRVYVVFSAGIGYVQCSPSTRPSAIYCEAQSEESLPALSIILTPERRSALQAAGYAPPGRSENYWKFYDLSLADAHIARDILTILHQAYGYSGQMQLVRQTEDGVVDLLDARPATDDGG